MKRLVFASVVFAAFMYVSCDQLPDTGDDLVSGTKVIKVDPVLSDYESKATSSAFENGDRIGVYVFAEETWLDNAEYVSEGGKFVSKSENYWYEDAELVSAIFSYYPYSSAYNGKVTSLDFSIKEDQSSQSGFSASEFMYAFTSAVPTEDPVRLPFEHALSKLVIKIENNLGEEITGVSLDNVYTSVTVSMTGAGKLVPKGDRSVVRFAKVKISGQDAWAAVLIPEKGLAPSLEVTLASGKTVEYTVENQIDLESGCSHTASVTLNKTDGPDVPGPDVPGPDVPEPEDPVSVVFDMSINDWNRGDEMIFVKEEKDVPSEEWTYLGVGSFVDDIMTLYSGLESNEMFVRMYEKSDTPGIYKIENPYMDWPYMKDFEPTGSGSIILNASDPSRIYIQESDLCMNFYGDTHSVGSICIENGFENDGEPYGYSRIDDTDGYIWFPEYSLYLNCSGNRYVTNKHGRSIFTLPGYVRPPLYGYQYLDYLNDYTENGISYAQLSVYSELDNTPSRLIFLEGRVESINEAVEAAINGKLDSYDASFIVPGLEVDFSIAIPESGTYTAIVYNVLPDGNYYYYYRYFSFIVEEDGVPECDFKLNHFKADETYPEGTLEFNFSCSNFHSIQFAVYETELLQGKDDSELEIMVTTDGILETIYYNGLDSSEGMSYYIPHLEPDTDYTLLLYATTTFGQTVFTKASARTSSEPEYTYLGEGMYYDRFFIFGGDYSSPVSVYVSENNPLKFRVMDPYRNYWLNPVEGVVGEEPEEKYFDVYIEEYEGVDYVHYSYIHTGAEVYVEQDDVWGEIVYDQTYWTTRKDMMLSTYYCIVIDDGVLQIAPSADIFGTHWHYDWRSADEAVLVVLPGAEYTSSATKAPMKKAAGFAKPEMKKMVSAPVIKELGTYPSYKCVNVKDIKKIEKVENNKLNIL